MTSSVATKPRLLAPIGNIGGSRWQDRVAFKPSNTHTSINNRSQSAAPCFELVFATSCSSAVPTGDLRSVFGRLLLEEPRTGGTMGLESHQAGSNPVQPASIRLDGVRITVARTRRLGTEGGR